MTEREALNWSVAYEDGEYTNESVDSEEIVLDLDARWLNGTFYIYLSNSHTANDVQYKIIGYRRYGSANSETITDWTDVPYGGTVVSDNVVLASWARIVVTVKAKVSGDAGEIYAEWAVKR